MNIQPLAVIERKYTNEARIISNEPVLKAMILRHPERLQHSRLLETFRQCNRCPLGAKTKVLMFGKDQKTISIPAVCSYYEKDKKICPVDKTQYIELMQDYYKSIETPEYEKEIFKYLLTASVSDAMIARDIDMMEKGKPGFTTAKHMEQAIKLFGEIVKLKTGGDKHLHLHQENIAEQIINAVFEEKPKIINIEKNNNQKTLDNFGGE